MPDHLQEKDGLQDGDGDLDFRLKAQQWLNKFTDDQSFHAVGKGVNGGSDCDIEKDD